MTPKQYEYVRRFEDAYDVGSVTYFAEFNGEYHIDYIDDFAQEMGISRNQVHAAILALDEYYGLSFELDNRNELYAYS
jgi:hypothetical protein